VRLLKVHHLQRVALYVHGCIVQICGLLGPCTPEGATAALAATN
jgi:hypothetical protein